MRILLDGLQLHEKSVHDMDERVCPRGLLVFGVWGWGFLVQGDLSNVNRQSETPKSKGPKTKKNFIL